MVPGPFSFFRSPCISHFLRARSLAQSAINFRNLPVEVRTEPVPRLGTQRHWTGEWKYGCRRFHYVSIIIVRGGLQRAGWEPYPLPVPWWAPLMPLSKHNSFCFGLVSGCTLPATLKKDNQIKTNKTSSSRNKGSLLPSWLSSFLWFAARNFKTHRPSLAHCASTRLSLFSVLYSPSQNAAAPSSHVTYCICFVSRFSWRKLCGNTLQCN